MRGDWGGDRLCCPPDGWVQGHPALLPSCWVALGICFMGMGWPGAPWVEGTPIWRWQWVGDPYGGIRDAPYEGNVCSGQGFGDIHAEEGEGHPRQMGQRGTPNRGKRGNEVRLPYMKG